MCETGDKLEVDFSTGQMRNLTRGTTHQFQPIEPELRTIIEQGGWAEHVKKRLANASAH